MSGYTIHILQPSRSLRKKRGALLQNINLLWAEANSSVHNSRVRLEGTDQQLFLHQESPRRRVGRQSRHLC